MSAGPAEGTTYTVAGRVRALGQALLPGFTESKCGQRGDELQLSVEAPREQMSRCEVRWDKPDHAGLAREAAHTRVCTVRRRLPLNY